MPIADKDVVMLENPSKLDWLRDYLSSHAMYHVNSNWISYRNVKVVISKSS